MSFFIKLLRNLKIRFFSPNLNPGSYLNEVSFRNVAEMGKYWYEHQKQPPEVSYIANTYP